MTHLVNVRLIFGVGYAFIFTDFVYDGLATFAVHVGHVVTQPDVAPLYDGIELGELVYDLIVKIAAAPVILARSCWMRFGGTKLPRTSSFIMHSAIYRVSLTSLLWLGSCLMR